LFYLLLIALSVAIGEYIYFSEIVYSQRRKILVLSNQNNKLKVKIGKLENTSFANNIKYVDSLYKTGYTVERINLYLNPIDTSPIVFKFNKSMKVNVFFAAEVSNVMWYEIIITINNSMIKGWVKETDIKLFIEEAK
jgi:hypothetical protein